MIIFIDYININDKVNVNYPSYPVGKNICVHTL